MIRKPNEIKLFLTERISMINNYTSRHRRLAGRLALGLAIAMGSILSLIHI